MRKLRKWFWFIPPMLLACTGEPPEPLQDVQRSCTAGTCMVCYIYVTEVDCVKEPNPIAQR